MHHRADVIYHLDPQIRLPLLPVLVQMRNGAKYSVETVLQLHTLYLRLCCICIINIVYVPEQSERQTKLLSHCQPVMTKLSTFGRVFLPCSTNEQINQIVGAPNLKRE